MYRLFGNAPVGRSDETQMSADWMAIENRKKAREKSGKHQKRRKAPNHESACRRKGRSQRQKWSPGLCMARREFLLYSRARRFAAPCRVGYETGENYGKRRWKAVAGNDSGERPIPIVRAATDSPRGGNPWPWRTGCRLCASVSQPSRAPASQRPTGGCRPQQTQRNRRKHQMIRPRWNRPTKPVCALRYAIPTQPRR